MWEGVGLARRETLRVVALTLLKQALILRNRVETLSLAL